MNLRKFFATVARGGEAGLALELEKFGAQSIDPVAGGVSFEANQETFYRTHLWSRLANRIFLPMREFPVRNPEDLYEEVKKFKWETFLKGDKTFAVDCTISGRINQALNHSQYAKFKVKDAIVDRLREKTGDRPNVDVENPHIGVVIYIRNGQATLNLDATGGSLHERGYRVAAYDAPLKETLAATILDVIGWHGECQIIDPMCGSGTLLTEAAIRAAEFAPGLFRQEFCFMHWPEFNRELWDSLVTEAKAKVVPVQKNLIFGFDSSARAIRAVEQNVSSLQGALGVDLSIALQRRAFELLVPPPGTEGKPGVIVMNPPYGDRMGDVEELKPLYKQMGDIFKQRFPGWRAYVFTGSPDLMKVIGLKPAQKTPLFNGPIECRLLKYELY